MTGATINIVCGDSAAGALVASRRVSANSILIQPDILSCGPLLNYQSLEEWRTEREQFWQQIWDGPEPPVFEPPERYLTTARERLQDAGRLVFWVGCGLSDQLMLASTPRVLELAQTGKTELSLAQFYERPGSTVLVNGLGSLTPGQIADGPVPEPVAEQLCEAWRAAWRAVIAPDPDPLLELLATTGPVDSPLHNALALLLDRYPDPASGISVWDQRLVDHASGQWLPLRDLLGATLRANWDSLDPVGDVYLRWRVERLASRKLNMPLLEIDGDRNEPRVRIRKATLEAVANGHKLVMLNGVNDWTAGVHLDSSAGRLWFRDGDTLAAAT
jgi:hypothetical protein